MSEIKLRVKVRSILEIILTAGTGILIRLNRNCICRFVSRLWVRVLEGELDSSLRLLTRLLLIGSSLGLGMP